MQEITGLVIACLLSITVKPHGNALKHALQATYG